MSKKNIIKTITIDIAGTEVEVTPEQAKNLHEALASLLGLDKPTQKVVEHIYRDRYYPYWTYPNYTVTSSGTSIDPNKWTVNYADSTGIVKMSIT